MYLTQSKIYQKSKESLENSFIFRTKFLSQFRSKYRPFLFVFCFRKTLRKRCKVINLSLFALWVSNDNDQHQKVSWWTFVHDKNPNCPPNFFCRLQGDDYDVCNYMQIISKMRIIQDADVIGLFKKTFGIILLVRHKQGGETQWSKTLKLFISVTFWTIFLLLFC